MPATIKPAPQLVGRNTDGTVHSSEGLLFTTSEAWAPRHRSFNFLTREENKPENRRIIQSSFKDLNVNSSSRLVPYRNGFVNGVIRAFQQDLHLVLRPDDVWISILTQFSMFVNANAEEVRSLFVDHEGKKNLAIDVRPFPVWDLDMGKFAQDMMLLIEKNIVDSELKAWIEPKFTTTTDDDKSVAAMVMMGTLQKYFEYHLQGGCGFPSVTLLGEPSDWQEILRRVTKLSRYGTQTAEWSDLLVPVIKRFIATFYLPDSQELKDFWLQVCHSEGRDGSGGGSIETYSGWITAFCFWRQDKYTGKFSRTTNYFGSDYCEGRKLLTLDGVKYPIIHPSAIPDGVTSVPVIVRDYATRLKHATTFIAGSIGMSATSTRNDNTFDTFQPRAGWWMLEDSVERM
ncbi:hypothetical protein AOQ84DRAFT_441846 [Glonium stellatum]|uniref:Uncharacterized protein n=1 Tax=Glonium stellatum TaxID=574774 RepID=A0A8E2JPP2_9PEZI|nr:hypothetical protein AOQ84DRAFT_441846 [Glonium stellatum]